MRRNLKEKALDRMQSGGDVKGGFFQFDVVRHIEHIGDHSMNISQSLQQVADH